MLQSASGCLPQLTLLPQYWAPGQSYNVVVTNPQAYFTLYTPAPGHVPATAYVLTSASFYAGNYYAEDSNVTATLPVYVSPTEITFTATVAAGAPTEADGWSLPCQFNTVYLNPGSIEITPCALPVIPNITSIQPPAVFAGASTPITVTGTGFIPTSNPNNCAPSLFYATVGGVDVPISNVTVVSSTQITAVVAPSTTGANPARVTAQAVHANDSTETATVTVSDYQYNSPLTPELATAPEQILPSPCTAPTIASISPNIWFAGQSYSVTLTGSGFTTFSAATATCPMSAVTVATGSGTVALTKVTVVSATKITATSAPAAADSTAGATITVSGSTPATIQADVLGTPQIEGSNGPVSAPNTPPPAVVGEMIILTTTPSVATLAGLPIPVAFSSNAWVVGGTNIGGYSPSTALAAAPKPTALKGPGLTTYWVYPNPSIPVTYQYRVSIPGVGNVWSTKATATFELTGPSTTKMTTEAYSALMITELIDSPCLPGDKIPFLQYGDLTGYYDEDCPKMGGETGTAGMKFSPPSSSDGSYSFVQILPSGNPTTYTNGTSSVSCTNTAGLDGKYPYPLQEGFNYVDDSPIAILGSLYTKVSRTFSAAMYLLWTSNIPNSIPVPIGYQSWHFNTSTANSAFPNSQSWSTPVSTYVGTNGDFVLSVEEATSQTSPFGYPTWGGLAVTSCK